MFCLPIEAIDLADGALRLRKRRHLAWLDGNAAGARYSFLACDPIEVCRSEQGMALLEALERIGADGRAKLQRPSHARPNRQATSSSALPLAPSEIPAWIGYIAYDALFSIEEAVEERLDRDRAVPALFFCRYDAVLVHDHRTDERFVCGDDAQACDRLLEALAESCEPPRAWAGIPECESADAHREAIGAALEAIGRGEIYQVNLARRWTVPYEGEPLALWLAMRRASPVPHGFFLDGGDHAVLASTMERFLRWWPDSGVVLTRPIKGTLPRSGVNDLQEAAVLKADEKERAEHAMIVDLMRNDLGRIALIGTVSVEELMHVEPYANLFHLVSTVRARLPSETNFSGLIRATFPPGSVTGAPKIRAMQLIEVLERSPRGIYTGCVGFIDRSGGASLAVAIRTAQAHRGVVYYHAGGGLVAPSDPDREVAETELKSRVFLEAIASLRRPDDR